MQAYIKGDIKAFQTLYQRHKGRVLGYLNSRLKTQDEAEDVFQEVFTVVA
jgi:RNA polymerase sigma-70 factor (ECF subfamily)